jgi:hypothetical protein
VRPARSRASRSSAPMSWSQRWASRIPRSRRRSPWTIAVAWTAGLTRGSTGMSRGCTWGVHTRPARQAGCPNLLGLHVWRARRARFGLIPGHMAFRSSRVHVGRARRGKRA